MDLAGRARTLASAAYENPADLDHPLEVADLAAGAGAGPEVVAAALLHDVVEDTGADLSAIAAELGSHVAGIVAAMTEDESIPGYAERKDEHRRRAAAAGPETALVFVADKLSNARRMLAGKKEPEAGKIGHYRATLELMRREHPGLPLLGELESELRTLRERDPLRAP